MALLLKKLNPLTAVLTFACMGIVSYQEHCLYSCHGDNWLNYCD